MTAGRFERTANYWLLILFSVIAIYPVLSILFLALHKKTDLVTGFAFPSHPDLSSFKAAWTEGRFATGFKASFIVAATVTVASAVLSIGTGYAFGTMRFFGDRIVFLPDDRRRRHSQTPLCAILHRHGRQHCRFQASSWIWDSHAHPHSPALGIDGCTHE